MVTLGLNNNFYIPQASHHKNVVHSIWQVERVNSYHNENIIPKGIVEIIFNFDNGDPIPAFVGSKRYHLSRCFIYGFNTLPIRLQLPPHQEFFRVRPQPMAIKKILGAPGCEFLDFPVDLTLVDSNLNTLWHQLAEHKDFRNRISVFLSWIDQRLPELQPQEKLINVGSLIVLAGLFFSFLSLHRIYSMHLKQQFTMDVRPVIEMASTI